jgi:hypothetical protein
LIDLINQPSSNLFGSLHILRCEEQIPEFICTERFEQISNLIQNISTEKIDLTIFEQVIKDVNVEVNYLIEAGLDIDKSNFSFFSYNIKYYIKNGLLRR